MKRAGAWNSLEALVSIVAGAIAGSVSLIGFRMSLDFAAIDERIFQKTLSSLKACGFAFEQQADGSVTLGSCTECQDLFMKSAEEHQESKFTNLKLLERLLFERRRCELTDLNPCCGCGAVFPQDYEAYVTTRSLTA